MSDIAAILRAPFDQDVIEKLPKPTKRDNQKGNCRECGGYHGLPAVHLDYVGHAAVTDRLLKADPTWTWEPMAVDERGLPVLSTDSQGRVVGLWIRLTVGGVTRPGYGSVEPGAFDAEKQLIGDALRNAAMRFGVALDLWAKGDLSEHEAGSSPAPASGGAAPDASPAAGVPSYTDVEIPDWYEPFNEERKSLGIGVDALEAVLGKRPSIPNIREWLSAEDGRTPKMLLNMAADRKAAV